MSQLELLEQILKKVYDDIDLNISAKNLLEQILEHLAYTNKVSHMQDKKYSR